MDPRTRLIAKTAAATTLLLAAGAAVGGYVMLESGWYNVAATHAHYQVVHTLLERGMLKSVRFHARDIAAPHFNDAQALRGARLYARHCQQCHGGPGVAPRIIGQSTQPIPGPLTDAARRWQPREIYWITRHGIKMAGMPAWGFHLADDELWAIVAFIEKLPLQTTDSYRAMTAGAAPPAPSPQPVEIDAKRGRIALAMYACNACHKIPGVTGPDTYVGPPLKGLGQRKYVAGVLPNTADNLVRWIRAPQHVDPQTTMPAVGVPERDARDMAAYLLKE